MTEKSIFVYKLFLSLHFVCKPFLSLYFCLYTFFVIKYFRFYFIFSVKTAPLPWKRSPPLSQQLPSKNGDPVKPSFFENSIGSSSLQKKGDAHYG